MTQLVSPSVHNRMDAAAVAQFQQTGFHIEPKCIFTDPAAVQLFHSRLEAVLNGVGDAGRLPYKVSKIPASLKCNGRLSFEGLRLGQQTDGEASGRRPNTTIHAINVWQADSLFRELVTSPAIGQAVVRLMRWEAYGCRVAQDQIWVKPPHSGALTYHRDTPYLDFEPKEVCTVWIPFDAVDRLEVGTLEYCTGSHRWGDERRGSANQFYNADYTALLRTAAEREASRRSGDGAPGVGSAESLLQGIVPVLGEAGCCSFHDGNTWHGSRANTTNGWRRGIGIHYVRGDAVFAEKTGKLWDDLRLTPSSRQLPEAHFPVVVPLSGAGSPPAESP